MRSSSRPQGALQGAGDGARLGRQLVQQPVVGVLRKPDIVADPGTAGSAASLSSAWLAGGSAPPPLAVAALPARRRWPVSARSVSASPAVATGPGDRPDTARRPRPPRPARRSGRSAPPAAQPSGHTSAARAAVRRPAAGSAVSASRGPVQHEQRPRQRSPWIDIGRAAVLQRALNPLAAAAGSSASSHCSAARV